MNFKLFGILPELLLDARPVRGSLNQTSRLPRSMHTCSLACPTVSIAMRAAVWDSSSVLSGELASSGPVCQQLADLRFGGCEIELCLQVHPELGLGAEPVS